MKHISLTIAAGLLAAAGVLSAQVEFNLGGRKAQVHSFVSQGFAWSDNNNFLTMKTSQGSFAMTDGGANISMFLTDKFRVGAQVYLRNIGDLGQGRPELDWAYGDYRVKDWFGVRAGKVKTPLGLYNDTQDTESLHTWALLPQSLYPVDLRSNTIAHIGGDIYGAISLRNAGSLSYTGYVGARTFDPRSGYHYYSADVGLPIDSVSGRAQGGDIRWNTPVEGLLLGVSLMDQTQDRTGKFTSRFRSTTGSLAGASYSVAANPQRTVSTYFDFSRGGWQFSGETRRNSYVAVVDITGTPGGFNVDASDKGWFLSVAYRPAKWLQLGTYHSRFRVKAPSNPADRDSDRINDQVVTARFDLKRFWNFKVEGHFMDGYGDVYSAHGFYLGANPGGVRRSTNMLVLRTGLSF